MLIRVKVIIHAAGVEPYTEREGLINTADITYAQNRQITPDRNTVFIKLRDGNALSIAGTIDDIEKAIEQPEHTTDPAPSAAKAYVTFNADEYTNLKARLDCADQIAAEFRQAVHCLDQIGAILGVSHTSDINGRESLVQTLRHRQLNHGFRPDGKTHGSG